MKTIYIWKVIAIDNYDRESVSDQLIKDNLSETNANILASKMNSEVDDDHPWYYKAIPEGVKLYQFNPNK